MNAGQFHDLRRAIPAVLLVGVASLTGAAVAINHEAVVALIGLMGVAGLIWLTWRAGLIEPWALLLVGLISANYNVFINANAFIAGGADRGQVVTIVATAGLALFAVVQNEIRKASGKPFRLGFMDVLFGALLLVASAAFLRGALAGNPSVYLLGDYGQLLQFIVAYAAIRLFAVNAGTEGMRALLLLLAVSWGLRAGAELVLAEFRGTAIIVLEGEELFRRTDPLGPLALPLMAGLALSERRRDRTTLLLVALALVATQNVLGFTRAHYMAVGGAMTLLVLVSLGHSEARRRVVRLAPLVGIACIALYVAVSPFHAAATNAWGRFQDTFDPAGQSRLHREAEVSVVLEHIRAEPLLGRGLGAEYLGVDPGTLQPTTTHFIHNDYLALWMRGGIALAGAWVAILAAALWHGLVRRTAMGSLTSAGAAAGIFGIALTGILSGSAFGYVAGPITALLIVVAGWNEAAEPVRARTEREVGLYPRVEWRAVGLERVSSEG